jgi:hypothetical protein
MININKFMSTQLLSIVSYLNLELPFDLLNQFNNTIMTRPPPLAFLVKTLGLFIKSMGCLEKPHLVATLFIIFWIFPSHQVQLFVALQTRVGLRAFEFLQTFHFKPIWLLMESCTK